MPAAIISLCALAVARAATAYGPALNAHAAHGLSSRLSVRGGAVSSVRASDAAAGAPLAVLVTGGAGYIGSHTVVELLNAGHNVIVVDNLCNADAESLERVKRITGKTVPFYRCDVRDGEGLAKIFAAHNIDAVIHFAGLKAVGESVAKPLEYYDCNVHGAISLLQAMCKAGCKQIVFSSSATVYGDPASVPVDETFPTSATNPYGQTKLMIEHILEDLAKSDAEWQVSVLRYFNPVGAHDSGTIGEDPKGIPNNLMPFIQQVAVGKRPQLSVFGSDYPTPDGTGVRDYIHVVDLAKGHLAALKKMTADRPGYSVWNLGTGRGYSVLEMVKAFEQASGRPIPYKLVERRPGDVACVYADTAKAASELGWKADLGLEAMCADSWRWTSGNPQGYASSAEAEAEAPAEIEVQEAPAEAKAVRSKA